MVICLVTAGGIVFSSVLVGVAVGVAMSLVKLLYKFTHLSFHVQQEHERTLPKK